MSSRTKLFAETRQKHVVVRNSDGDIVDWKDPMALAKDWLALGGDEFYRKYGFKWEPDKKIREKVEKAVAKRDAWRRFR